MLPQIAGLKPGLWALLILGVAAHPLPGADFGKADVFGQGGYYTELGQGGGTWAIAGGGAGANLGSRFALFAEFNYVRASESLVGVSATGNLYQAGAGARIFLPLRRDRLRAYLPVVGGFLRGNAMAAVNGVENWHEWESAGYVGTGFGVEIGITKRFGLRPEFRYFREFWSYEFGGSSQNNGVRATIGVYYRLGVR